MFTPEQERGSDSAVVTFRTVLNQIDCKCLSFFGFMRGTRGVITGGIFTLPYISYTSCCVFIKQSELDVYGREVICSHPPSEGFPLISNIVSLAAFSMQSIAALLNPVSCVPAFDQVLPHSFVSSAGPGYLNISCPHVPTEV